jgi:hypothetical protein
MLLKVIGHLLITAKSILKGHLEMSKGYWICSGQLTNSIGKPQGNTQIKQMPVKQMFQSAGCDEETGNLGIS